MHLFLTAASRSLSFTSGKVAQHSSTGVFPDCPSHGKDGAPQSGSIHLAIRILVHKTHWKHSLGKLSRAHHENRAGWQCEDGLMYKRTHIFMSFQGSIRLSREQKPGGLRDVKEERKKPDLYNALRKKKRKNLSCSVLFVCSVANS